MRAVYKRAALVYSTLMPPKRGKADGSPAKAPMQSSTKRTRRDSSQLSQSASGTGVNLPSHYNVDEDPSLIVDYNETTPLPSPQSGDEHSALMRHMSPSFEAPVPVEASMLPTSEGKASSSAPKSAATTTEHATSKGVVSTQSDVTPQADVLTIHNGGSDSGECELKAPTKYTFGLTSPPSRGRLREWWLVTNVTSI